MEVNKKTVLIVEDNEGLNLLLCKKVKDLAYNTVSVYSAMEALNWLKANTPYIMILDYNLPDMSGKSMLMLLQTENKTIPPFLVSTGRGDESIAVEMMKLGAKDYLVKNRYFHDKLPEILKRIDNEIENENKRKQAELELVQSEKKYRELADSLTIGVFETDINGTVTFANQMIINKLGYTFEEINKGINILSLVVDEDKEKAFARSNQIISKKITSSSEYRLKQKSGDTFPVYISSIPIIKNNQAIGVRGTIIDFTERKKTEQEIIKTKQRLQKAQKMAQVGNWEVDLKTGILTASEEALRIYGISNNNNNLTYTEVEKFVLPEYETIRNEALKNLLEKNIPFDIEYQIKNPLTGELCSIHSIAELEFNSMGKPTQIIGVIQDITTRKHLENKLRILSNAIEQNPASIVITNNKGDIEYVNPKFSELTGYTLQEALGKNPRILNSGLNPPEIYTALWSIITKGQTWRGEFCNMKKGGELYWESAVIAPVYNSFNKITHYVAVKEDITDKKDVQKKLLNAVIQGEERERNRFSKELHDGLGPLLSTIKLYFQWISETDDAEKKLFLTQKGNININEAIQTMREISNNLSPRALKTFGVVLAIRSFIEGLNQSKNLNIFLNASSEKRYAENIEIALYRIVCELINNSIKHSKASEIKIELYLEEQTQLVQLRYFDNGKGFNFDKISQSINGMGLTNIFNRVNGINGKINIDTSPGAGVSVNIEIPNEN